MTLSCTSYLEQNTKKIQKEGWKIEIRLFTTVQ